MRWPYGLLLGMGCLSALNGCRNCDLVEAELRTRDRQVRDLRAEVGRTDAFNAALLRELQELRCGTARFSPEQASQTYTLKQVTLGRQTGGYDDDGYPGAEALEVFLEPRDADGHPIKAPGSVHIEALEISPEGLKTPLSSWDIPPEHLRRTWRSGLLSTGYDLILPWKNWPTSEKLRVIVQFTLADGRVFEADKDVTLRLAPNFERKPKPALIPADPSRAPNSELPLPPPRKLEAKPPDGAKAWIEPPIPDAESLDPIGHWRSKKPPVPIFQAIQLLRPVPMPYGPGESPEP